MKLRIAFAFALSIFALAARAEKIALVGGTLINPATSQVLENSVVVVDGDRVSAVGARKDMPVHFFQSGDLFTRPDVVDLTKVRPYAEEVAWIKRNLPDTFERYLRSGITSVVDVGGPFWNFEVRKTANTTAKAPRVAV